MSPVRAGPGFYAIVPYAYGSQLSEPGSRIPALPDGTKNVPAKFFPNKRNGTNKRWDIYMHGEIPCNVPSRQTSLSASGAYKQSLNPRFFARLYYHSHVFQLNVILYSQLSFNCNFRDKFLITSLPPKFIFEIKTIRISIFKIISMSKCKMVQNLLQELYRERHEPAIWRPQHEQNYTNKRRIVKILSQRGGWFESKNPK